MCSGKRKFPAPTKLRGTGPPPSHGRGRPPPGVSPDPTKMAPSNKFNPSLAATTPTQQPSSSYAHKKQPSSDQQQQATTRTAWGPASTSKRRDELKKSVEQHGSGKQGVSGAQSPVVNSTVPPPVTVNSSSTRVKKGDVKTQLMSRVSE